MKTKNSMINKLAIDNLFSRTKKYRNSDEYFKFLRFISKFKHYSYFNSMLIYIQNSNVDFFGSAGYWEKEFDRKVKSDARPYIILQPFGPIMLVYDIFETEGELTPQEFLEKELDRNTALIRGTVDEKVLENALYIARKHKINILYKPLSFFKSGHITTILSGKLEIVLKEGMTTEQNLSVLIHELAHLFLGHTGHENLYTKVIDKQTKKEKDKIVKLLNRKIPRETEELEAETVSYLICKKLGIEVRSEEYLSDYLSEEAFENFSYEVVVKIADKIKSMFFI